MPLDGEWHMTLDLFDEGLRQKWFELDESPPSQWAAPRDYEIEAGERVPVPSCWNVLKPEWTHFEGAAWYTRWFEIEPGTPGERIIPAFRRRELWRAGFRQRAACRRASRGFDTFQH